MRVRDRATLRVQRRLLGIRIAHHVAVHVTAGREGVEQRAVHLVDRLPEIFLQDAVKLKRLPRGELERAVRVRVGQRVEREPLGGRADAAGHADARHEAERFLLSFFAPDIAEVAVVLRVDAVEFRELRAVLGDAARRPVREIAQDIAAQKIALGFDAFVFVQRLRRWRAGFSGVELMRGKGA